MNMNRRAGRTEFYQVEGYGRFFSDRQYPEKQITEYEDRENQFYRFFQLECAGDPEGKDSLIPIQPVRIRCTAWDTANVLNASLLDGLTDRSQIWIRAFMDPWFQIWGPNGTPEGIRKTVPNGGRMNGHSRPWETMNIPHGIALMETAQLTITEIRIVNSSQKATSTNQKPMSISKTTPKKGVSESDIDKIMSQANQKANPTPTPIEKSELGKQAAQETQTEQSVPPEHQTPQSTAYDTSEDFLKVSAIVRIKDLSKSIIDENNEPKRAFSGIANQDYKQGEILIEQQPLRLINTVKGENAEKINGWKDNTPVHVGGYLKALNWIWIPTEQEGGTKDIIPGPGEENGQARPWDIIYNDNWDNQCCIIPSFQIIVKQINKADLSSSTKEIFQKKKDSREFTEMELDKLFTGESINDNSMNTNEDTPENANQNTPEETDHQPETEQYQDQGNDHLDLYDTQA